MCKWKQFDAGLLCCWYLRINLLLYGSEQTHKGKRVRVTSFTNSPFLAHVASIGIVLNTITWDGCRVDSIERSWYPDRYHFQYRLYCYHAFISFKRFIRIHLLVVNIGHTYTHARTHTHAHNHNLHTDTLFKNWMNQVVESCVCFCDVPHTWGLYLSIWIIVPKRTNLDMEYKHQNTFR